MLRDEPAWPIPRTRWTKFYFDPADQTLRITPPQSDAQLRFEAPGEGLTFLTPPLREELEITGPAAAKLFASSLTRDADLFLVLRIFAPDGREIVFQGAQDPRTPIAHGWLRASHRKLDPRRSLPYRPFHTHDEVWPLTPDEVVELDIEIWPTSIVVPPEHRIGLSIRGSDYRFDGPPVDVPGVPHPLTGVGPFLHEEPANRPPEIFGGVTTLHFSARRQPYVLLPVIPRK